MARNAHLIVVAAVFAAGLAWLAGALSGDADSPEPAPRADRSTAPAPAEELDAPAPAPAAARLAPSAPHRAPDPQGALVHGRVMAADGAPVEDAVVTLVDADWQPLDEVACGADGAFEVADPGLEGAQLTITVWDREEARSLSPLRPGEVRSVDVVLGPVREVVGWVLDLHGDPSPGVRVTLRAQNVAAAWTAWTDVQGAFRFSEAPADPVLVEADGYDLGRASARLAASAAERRELTLILEPTGTVTVIAPGAPEGVTAALRCWDQRHHGADPLHVDDLAAHEREWVDVERFDDGAALDVTADEPADPDYDFDMPDPDEVMGIMEEALQSYDPADPEASLATLFTTVMTSFSQLDGMLREEVDGGQGMDVEELARAAARQMIEADPAIVEQMGQLAAAVRGGKSLMEATMELHDVEYKDDPAAMVEVDAPSWTEGPDGEIIMDEPFYGEPEVAQIEPPVGDDALGDEIGEPFPIEIDGFEGDGPIDEDWAVEGSGPADPAPAHGWVFFPGASDIDRRAEVARGPLGEPLGVRGAFRYDVVLIGPEGGESYCGDVLVLAGEDVVLRCGLEPAPAVVTGRAVDPQGAPLVGMSVTVSGMLVDDGEVTTDADGRFRLAPEVQVPTSATVTVAPTPFDTERYGERRNVNLLPGAEVDVGDVPVFGSDERPVGWMEEAFGGVGGLVSLDPTGLRVDDIEADVPLELAGVEPGDTIVRVDGAPTARLPMDELLARLRGEEGTPVELRIRTSIGELYEISLERATIPPASESWPDDGEIDVIGDPEAHYVQYEF